MRSVVDGGRIKRDMVPLRWPGVVVVTHNSAATLPACLRSIVAAGCTSIVVVDNASTDGTIQRAVQFPVQLIRQARNVGFGAACNHGVSALRTRCVLLLNPDASLTPGAVRGVTDYLESYPAVAAVGLRLIDGAGVPQPDNYGWPVTLWSLGVRQALARAGGGRAQGCGWVSGAAMLVRRDAFKQVGGFDEQFFMYWEDVDLCQRLREAGWRVAFLPTALAVHQRGQSTDNMALKTAWYDCSADRYFQKHYAYVICWLQRLARRLYRFWVPLVR